MTSFFRTRRFWVVLLGGLALNWILMFALAGPPKRVTLPYTTLVEQVSAGNVKSLNAQDNALQGEFKKSVTSGSSSGTLFQTQRPVFAKDDLVAMLAAQKVPVTADPPGSGQSPLLGLLLGFGPTLLLVGLFLYISRRAAGAAGGAGGLLGAFGKSKAKLYTSDAQAKITFADVAGIDEAKADLAEVVDFLKTPAKYEKLGATIPRGVLLIGPPGTGKTLLARAVAGEANRPFFSLSASEFVEAIVGVGASRVRDLFTQAKAAAPSIIFIDELDAIGRSRSAGSNLGGNDEREQTLNQILTEMDGFTPTQQVVVLAATNRAEILDAALLRPGRFDRRVTVSPPDRAGREAILRIHACKVPLGPDADLAEIAGATAGFVGAELRNVINEAALIAARKGRDAVAQEDLTEAARAIGPRLATADHARPGRATADRLSRVGACADGVADPGRGPGEEGHHHSARAVAGGHLQSAHRRPLQLPGELPARPHRWGAWRPGRGGGRLWHDHHRRRVRPAAGAPDRPLHGHSMGHVTAARTHQHHAHAGWRWRGRAFQRGDGETPGRRGPPDRRRVPPAGGTPDDGQPGPA